MLVLDTVKITLMVKSFCLAGLVLLASAYSHADEAAIRRNLPTHIPDLPTIDEVSPSPINGLWEVRLGAEIIYTDAQGTYIIQGHIVDAQRKINLTERRIQQLTAFDFSKLPLEDAVVWKQGTGERQVVVFADPNCGFCKKFEVELSSVKDITVYTFLMPILGEDSADKAKTIWCAEESGKVWRDWMLGGYLPSAPVAACDIAALQRNLALGEKHGVVGTPTLVFNDSSRVTGILNTAEIEQYLAEMPLRKNNN